MNSIAAVAQPGASVDFDASLCALMGDSTGALVGSSSFRKVGREM